MDVGLELEFSYLPYKHFANEAVSSVPGPGINPDWPLMDAWEPVRCPWPSGFLSVQWEVGFLQALRDSVSQSAQRRML